MKTLYDICTDRCEKLDKSNGIVRKIGTRLLMKHHTLKFHYYQTTLNDGNVPILKPHVAAENYKERNLGSAGQVDLTSWVQGLSFESLLVF